MSEQFATPTYSSNPNPAIEIEGWRQAVEDTSQYPELHAIAKNHLERANARAEVTPEHHQVHIDIARPVVPNIDSLPAIEQDFLGEIIEIGNEALEDAELDVISPTESYSDPEKLNQRIGEALASCEVEETPEVHEAIKGFYEDHYLFAELIDKAVGGTLTLEECDTVLVKNVGNIITAEDVDSFIKIPHTGRYSSEQLPSVNHASTLLAAVAKEQLANTDSNRASDLRKATLIQTSLLLEQLFNESALPVTTVGEEEAKIINDLFDKIAAASTTEFSDAVLAGDTLSWGNGITYASSASKQELITRLEQTRSEFWSDTRMAGQLLYHNTGHLDDIAKSGGLMSRLEQKRRTGVMNTQTREASHGEHHSVVPHFSETYDPWGYKITKGVKGEDGHVSTGTIAIPLANMIEAAPYARDAQYAVVTAKTEGTLEKVPIHDTVGTIGVGGADEPGESGSDRVFFASATQTGDKAPDEYILKNGGPRMPETRNTLIFVGDEEIAASPTYGLGERFPDRLLIPKEYQAAELIKVLQDRYIDMNRGKIVVPLRRGVFDFIPENMEWASSYRAPQTKSYQLEV